MGLADAASAARLKVSAALLPELRDAADGAAQRFHLDAPAWYREPATPELLPAVADAVWDDRRIATRYRRKDTEVERELEPYGLVLKAGVWYLAARAGTKAGAEAGAEASTEIGTKAGTEPGSDMRVYRIDRFTSVTPLDVRFTRGPDFDLPAFWAERAAQFARSILRDEVTVRLTPDGARQLRHVTDRAGAEEALAAAGEPDEQGWITVTLPVESLDVAYSQLLGLGPEAEVIAPPELRERFAAAAGRMQGLYGR